MLARFLANAAALAVATALVPGITITGTTPTHRVVVIAVVALVFGVLNTLVKPLLKVVSLPFIVLSLGLFLLVINTLMLLATSAVAHQLGQPWHVATIGAAFIGSIIISVVSALVGGILQGERR